MADNTSNEWNKLKKEIVASVLEELQKQKITKKNLDKLEGERERRVQGYYLILAFVLFIALIFLSDMLYGENRIAGLLPCYTCH